MTMKLDALDQTKIGVLTSYTCKQVRKAKTCPNKNECGNTFLRKEGLVDLQLFREKFWSSNWREVLRTELSGMYSKIFLYV